MISNLGVKLKSARIQNNLQERSLPSVLGFLSVWLDCMNPMYASLPSPYLSNLLPFIKYRLTISLVLKPKAK